MEFLYSLIPTVIFAIVLSTGFLVAVLAKKGFPWSKKKRSPFTSHFLRAPGQSLQTKVEDLRLDVVAILAQLTLIPMLLLLIPLINFALTKKEISQFNIFFFIVIGTASIVYWLYKLFITVKELQQMRLGLEGEVSVGQELNQLMLNGFRIFHDFPADGFNIDHIVVGNTGVFAIETKARSKPTSDNRKNDALVEYDGKTLKFPYWNESKPVEQANIQAKWLKNWLSKAVGDTVFVSPVLAIPGWFVKQTARSDTYIYNGKSPERLFPRVSHPPLTEQMIKRICHQLDAKCRDIEPKAYLESK